MFSRLGEKAKVIAAEYKKFNVRNNIVYFLSVVVWLHGLRLLNEFLNHSKRFASYALNIGTMVLEYNDNIPFLDILIY